VPELTPAAAKVTHATHLALAALAPAPAAVALPLSAAGAATWGGASTTAGGGANTPCATSSKNSDMSNCAAGSAGPSSGGGGARAAEKLDAGLEVELPPCEKYEDMESASSPAAGWWYGTGCAPTAAMTEPTTGAEALYL
jgi:hypothetical protein